MKSQQNKIWNRFTLIRSDNIANIGKNKQLLDKVFADIQNSQGRGRGHQPQPLASADNLYLHLDYSGYHKNPIQ